MNEQQFKSLLKTIGFEITEVPNVINLDMFFERNQVEFHNSWYANCPDGFLRGRSTLMDAWEIAIEKQCGIEE